MKNKIGEFIYVRTQKGRRDRIMENVRETKSTLNIPR